MKSSKPVKRLEDLLSKKQFFFPDSLSTDRVQGSLERCITLRINGTPHTIITGRNVEINEQEFAILRDAGIISANQTFSSDPEFDPLYEA